MSVLAHCLRPITATEAVRTSALQVDATWALSPDEVTDGYLLGTTASVDTDAIKAISVADRTPAALQPILERGGVRSDREVAVYDRCGLFSAPWVWWMLLRMGQPARVVEGWTEEGPLVLEPGDFKRSGKPLVREATLEDVVDSYAQTVDARGPGRFAATEPEPRDGVRGGHIPGSVNLHYKLLKSGRALHSEDHLRSLFAKRGIDLAKPIITTCGSGVTACLLAYALMRAGASDVRVYMGSWAEYGASDHPVETGA